MVLEQLGIQMKKMHLDALLSLYKKVKSMWIMDLNMKHKTMKLPEENIGENLCHL